MNRPTVFVVDDDDDFRESLVNLLTALGYRTASYDSAEAFRCAYHPSQPGCLVLDIRMPGQNGLDLYADMVQAGQRIPVLFITAHANVSTAVAAMKTGAVEFLEKPFSRERLVMLVDQALQLDKRWRASDERFATLDEQLQSLSKGDRETLDLILDGATNKVMAARLFITERAVELRRQRLMQRLGVRSVAELLEMTLTHRILSEVRAASTHMA